MDTALLTPKEWLTIDAEYALTTDVTLPIILFEAPKEKLFIADGNHRLYKAVKEGIKRMNVIIISQEKHLGYLYESTKAVYDTVMEGLQSEGIFIDKF